MKFFEEFPHSTQTKGCPTMSHTNARNCLPEESHTAAERDTADRYLASFLSDRVGNEFSASISGIARFGAFAKLDETGADGLIPIRSIGSEFFHYDRDEQSLTGSDSGLTIRIGQRVVVRLAEAVPVTGGLLLDLLSIEDSELPTGRRNPGKGPRRKGARSKHKKARERRKLRRKRT